MIVSQKPQVLTWLLSVWWFIVKLRTEKQMQWATAEDRIPFTKYTIVLQWWQLLIPRIYLVMEDPKQKWACQSVLKP